MSAETITLAPGAFCWVDLFTHDTAAAAKFYGDLFGWQSKQVFEDADGPYSIFSLAERPAAGLMGITAEMKAMNVPPNWTSHVLVKSAEETVKRAEGLGATVLKAPCAAGEEGVVAALKDPTGAVFCVWEPKKKNGDAVYNVPGALMWNELWTSDVERAKAFYADLFGWDIAGKDFGPMHYTMIQNQGRGNGGIMKLPDAAAKMGAPSNWVVYFSVDDCDATVARAVAAGGRSYGPPTDMQGVGRFATLADPQGASFAVMSREPT